MSCWHHFFLRVPAPPPPLLLLQNTYLLRLNVLLVQITLNCPLNFPFACKNTLAEAEVTGFNGFWDSKYIHSTLQFFKHVAFFSKSSETLTEGFQSCYGLKTTSHRRDADWFQITSLYPITSTRRANYKQCLSCVNFRTHPISPHSP